MNTATSSSSAKTAIIGVIAAVVIGLPIAGLIGGELTVPVKYNLFALAKINADQTQQLEQSTTELSGLIAQVKDKTGTLQKQSEIVSQQLAYNDQMQTILDQQNQLGGKGYDLMGQIVAGETPLVGLTQQIATLGTSGVSVANATTNQVDRLYNALGQTNALTNHTIDQLKTVIALLQESVNDFKNVGKLKSLLSGGSGGASGSGGSGSSGSGGSGSPGLPPLPLPLP